MALRAAAQGEYFKALYLSRIAIDYDQFSVDLWENHATFAEQAQLTSEAQQARANARARRQSDMRPLTPTLDYGMPLPSSPATLADWAALFSLLADDTAARVERGDRLAIAPVTSFAPLALQEAWGQMQGMKRPDSGTQGAMAGLPSPVLWASGRSRAAFVDAEMRLPGGVSGPALRTTLGAQAAGQPPVQAPVALAGHVFAVPRLASLCAAGAQSCTPALLPLEVILSDDDFADVGIVTLPRSRTALQRLLEELSARGSAGESLVLMPGNTGAAATPTSLAAVDAEGACISFELGPQAWLSPTR
ncbi:MAG: hypothetical protein IT483_07395 [Gammaproteobacteria bacterium]|nr:hypothetical protein [Gammaproteobacteria bacterium]